MALLLLYVLFCNFLLILSQIFLSIARKETADFLNNVLKICLPREVMVKYFKAKTFWFIAAKSIAAYLRILSCVATRSMQCM